MRVSVDYDLCEANALCEAIAPEVFEVDDDDNLHLHDPEVTEENQDRMQQAVDSCPRQALRIGNS